MFTRFLPALDCGCQRTLANYNEQLFLVSADFMGFWRTITEGGELMTGVPCRHLMMKARGCI